MDETIEKLAEALGVTADNLWAVLVRQASITAFESSLWLAVWLAATILVSRLDTTKGVALFTYDDDGDRASATAFFFALKWIAFGFCIFHGTLWAPGKVATVLSGIFNPEYLALREILEAIGS